ncbi:MAG: alanine racemase [Burkholderiaceae bacterium]
MNLETLSTPCLVLDQAKMDRNIARMKARALELGVAFRPHLKTGKCVEVARRMMSSDAGPATVSTLREAEQFFAAGVTDILYAVGISPAKLAAVADLRARGCDLRIILDNADTARAVSAFCAERGVRIPVLIEIDSDSHRSGIAPEAPQLLEVAAALTDGADLLGVMTHAGGSYDRRSIAAIRAVAEQERAAVVRAAERLRAAGWAVSVVSVGSTPTATFAQNLDGVSELRTGVFVFQDLVMAGLEVCPVEDLALSLLVTVIGHQAERNWVITDGGWMAISRDRGTATHAVDQGYGLVCDLDGAAIADHIVSGANQEHGIVARRDGGAIDWSRFPIGSRLRVLPNHACAMAAQHAEYHVVAGARDVLACWQRFGGW